MAPRAVAGSGFAAVRRLPAEKQASKANKKAAVAKEVKARTYEEELASAAYALRPEEQRAGGAVDLRLTLSCCQPLALRGGVNGEKEGSTAYIDAEGALLTTTGGRFGQQFDEVCGRPIALTALTALTALSRTLTLTL